MDKIEALVGGGLADFWMTVTKVGYADTSGKIKESSTILELSPRSLGTDHDGITSDPPQSLRDVPGTDALQMGRSTCCHESSRESVEAFGKI